MTPMENWDGGGPLAWKRLSGGGAFPLGLRDGGRGHGQRRNSHVLPSLRAPPGELPCRCVHCLWSVSRFLNLAQSAEGQWGAWQVTGQPLCSLPAPAVRTQVTRALGVMLTLYQV